MFQASIDRGLSMVAEYPEQIDLAWMARDGLGQLAFFISAGQGPVPVYALEYEDVSIFDLEDICLNLPVVTSTQLIVKMPSPVDFSALSDRGFYTYDWRDLHRSEKQQSKKYELVSKPLKPLMADGFDVIPKDYLQNMALSGIHFGADVQIDVTASLACKALG